VRDGAERHTRTLHGDLLHLRDRSDLDEAVEELKDEAGDAKDEIDDRT